jgi:hypothetical protein
METSKSRVLRLQSLKAKTIHHVVDAVRNLCFNGGVSNLDRGGRNRVAAPTRQLQGRASISFALKRSYFNLWSFK